MFFLMHQFHVDCSMSLDVQTFPFTVQLVLVLLGEILSFFILCNLVEYWRY